MIDLEIVKPENYAVSNLEIQNLKRSGSYFDQSITSSNVPIILDKVEQKSLLLFD